MNLKDQNILFLTRTMKLGGTENVVLQLCEIFKPLVNKIVVCSCGGVNVEKLQAMGINHYDIPDIEGKSPCTMLTVMKVVRHITKEEKITIIHTHHRMAAFYVSLLGLYKKCKFLNTSHNTFSNKIQLTRFAYKHATLIACGEMVKKNLVDVFGLSGEQVTVVHNAVKPFVEDITSDLLIKQLKDKGCFVVGNVGRLSEQKGMEYYIQAIPEIIKTYPKARFLIIGSGEDEKNLKGLATDIGIDGVVYFTGYRTDIQNIMSQMDLVVLSSLWEGLPLTPIEAFSVGKTIVATSVDGTLEIVRDGIDGYLITPKNSADLAKKVCSLIGDKIKREQFEVAAKKRYNDKFSFMQFSKSYIQFYEGISK